MSTRALPEMPQVTRRRLYWAAFLAFFLEAGALVWVGSSQHWLVHPQKNEGLDTEKFIEAQMVQMPPEPAHLTEEKPVHREARPRPELALSKKPKQGREAKPEEKKQLSEEQNNQTTGQPHYAPSHGPIAVYSPPPVIPAYLKNEDLQANVVIDFYISAQGGVTPRLAGSSGNEELDAIALNTAKKWQFRPAEKDHQAVDSKVRLRIVFEVH